MMFFSCWVSVLFCLATVGCSSGVDAMAFISVMVAAFSCDVASMVLSSFSVMLVALSSEIAGVVDSVSSVMVISLSRVSLFFSLSYYSRVHEIVHIFCGEPSVALFQDEFRSLWPFLQVYCLSPSFKARNDVSEDAQAVLIEVRHFAFPDSLLGDKLEEDLKHAKIRSDGARF